MLYKDIILSLRIALHGIYESNFFFINFYIQQFNNNANNNNKIIYV
jgi:hypothetical protein